MTRHPPPPKSRRPRPPRCRRRRPGTYRRTRTARRASSRARPPGRSSSCPPRGRGGHRRDRHRRARPTSASRRVSSRGGRVAWPRVARRPTEPHSWVASYRRRRTRRRGARAAPPSRSTPRGDAEQWSRLRFRRRFFVHFFVDPSAIRGGARPPTLVQTLFRAGKKDKLARTARARSHGRCRTHGRDSRVRRRGESRRAGVRYVDHWIFPYLDDTRDHLSFGRHPVHVAHAFPLLRFQQTATARWWTPWGPSTWLTCRRARSSA